jgi:tetraacyldisaccharide 4'-kinase
VVSVPTIAVGNLTVGGTGKTPIAAWIAQYYSQLGLTPGVVLRGYGGDEGPVHRRLVPDAIVKETPDRSAGASDAVADGADVIVLDDAYQRLDVSRDLNIVVVSAESGKTSRWTLPAGPWRENWGALKRADIVVISRKSARFQDALEMLQRVKVAAGGCLEAVALLSIAGFHRLESGSPVEFSELDGAEVVVAAGIADPDSFVCQCEAFGAHVRAVNWNDHQKITRKRLQDLVTLSRAAEFTIVTEKDAGKMRGRWPAAYAEPIVAELRLVWEEGGDVVESALNSAVERENSAAGEK